MGKIYDNWGMLVEAVLRREHDRQLAMCHSRDHSIISDDDNNDSSPLDPAPQVTSFLGKAGIAGLEKAVEVLDTLGSRMTNINSGYFVLQGLESASNCVEDMDEWLGIFNVKLRHMREDIESIETRNNKLEMQSVNNKSLVEELEKLLEGLRIPSEYAACLTGGSFDEARMLQNIEACEWLANALRNLEAPKLDRCYVNMKSVRETRAELDKLRNTFVKRASEFLRNYFASLVDFMISDKSYFSQRGQLKRPDHADLRYKCRTYARLLQHLKSLDKNCLGPLRKAYCSSLNLLLRREAREFANELRASTKASRNPNVWLANSADTSIVSDAYAKMLTIFIPLLVDESSFFAHFMCFEVPALVPPGGANGKSGAGNDEDNDDDLGIMDIDDNEKSGPKTADLEALNESLHDLLDGIQEDFYAVVDWAYKIDPLLCISMHGITERYISGQNADAAGFVRILLDDLENRISMQFSRFVEEACHQIERNERNVRQVGVLPYIPRNPNEFKREGAGRANWGTSVKWIRAFLQARPKGEGKGAPAQGPILRRAPNYEKLGE